MNTITSLPLRSLVAGALLSALALSSAPVSSANEGTTPAQVIVKFAGLDISTSQGAAALYGRIHSAAINVCSRMYNSNFAYMLYKADCIKKTIADAVTKVDVPALSAIFASRYGVAAPVELAAADAR
jgi:UrcA family protein